MHLPRIFLSLLTILALSSPPAGWALEQPNLLLAKVYSDDIDISQYWVSEKYDGVRAYWDGHRLISRRGNAFHAPAWFTAGFPKTPLDGELWMGRGTFEALASAVRKEKPVDAEWLKLRYMVYELPGGAGDFTHRLKTLKRILESVANPRIELAPQFRIDSREALMNTLRAVVKAGGEGLMLHRASARYRGGRHDDLLKLKPYQDAEATVVAQLPGKGKFRGMMGSLEVVTNDGRRFRIGSGFSDAERRNPPPIGATITYRYHGLSQKGIPRFASFLRIRPPE